MTDERSGVDSYPYTVKEGGEGLPRAHTGHLVRRRLHLPYPGHSFMVGESSHTPADTAWPGSLIHSRYSGATKHQFQASAPSAKPILAAAHRPHPVHTLTTRILHIIK